MPKTIRTSDDIRSITGEFTGDVGHNNNYALGLQNIPDLNAKGQGYWLNGEDDYINIDLLAVELVNVNNTEGAIVWKGQIHDFTENYNSIWSFADTDGNEYLRLRISDTDYKIEGLCSISATMQWHFSTDNLFEEDVEYEIFLTHDGTSPFLYINGQLEPITFITDLDKTVWFADTTGIDNGDIGAILANTNPISSFLNCAVNKFYALNKCPTALEVKAFSSGAPIPYKYLGANQTEKVTNGGFDADSDWTKDAVWTINAGTGKAVYDGIALGAIEQPLNLVVGKKYRIGFTISDNAGVARIGIRDGGINYPFEGDLGAFINLSNGSYIYESLCTKSANTISFEGSSSLGGLSFVLDDFSITQIGCVLQLEQPGIGHSQWLDNSGNELHGEVSGAIPTNLPSDNVERFRHIITITGDTTFTDIIPAKYELEKIIFIESAGNEATLNLGTTSDNDDIFSLAIIAASQPTTIVINKTFSISAEQSLYLNDATGGDWNSASLTITIIMRRII